MKVKHWFLRGFLYVFVFFAIYSWSLWKFFPYSDAAAYFSQLLKNQGLTVSATDVNPGAFPSIKIASLKASFEKNDWASLELRNVIAKLSLPDLLKGKPAAYIDAASLGGKIKARLTLSKPRSIELVWNNLDLSQAPRPPILSETKVAGIFSGRMETSLDATTIEKLGGKMEGDISGAMLGPGRIMGIPIPVPEISLGKGRLNLICDEGSVDIKTVRFEEGSLGINFEGDVRLRSDIARSLIYGNLELSPDQKLDKDLGLGLGVLGIPKAPDGTYKTRVRGRLSAPLFRAQ